MRYKLRVRCEIQQTDDHGSYMGQGLTIEETTDLDASSFMEVAAILGRFHDLAKVIEQERTQT